MRFDDAISSTKAAVAEGIAPGGGLALLRTIAAVARGGTRCEGDERTGLAILRRALEAPARQIAENSAADGGVVVDRTLHAEGNTGFDAARKQYVDLLEAGIVDLTKVVRLALENAVLRGQHTAGCSPRPTLLTENRRSRSCARRALWIQISSG